MYGCVHAVYVNCDKNEVYRIKSLIQIQPDISIFPSSSNFYIFFLGENDSASHASLGFTEKRKALFMDPGTIYMYYSRGGDSLNFTCSGNSGNAVLVKSGYPVLTTNESQTDAMLQKMRQLNPLPLSSNASKGM